MGSSRRSRSAPPVDGLEDVDFHHVGFTISLRVSPDSDKSQLETVVEELVSEVLVPVSLECGGGTQGYGFEGFVTRWKGSATEDDRRSVSRWLAARPEVEHFELGPLSDAWYGV